MDPSRRALSMMARSMLETLEADEEEQTDMRRRKIDRNLQKPGHPLRGTPRRLGARAPRGRRSPGGDVSRVALFERQLLQGSNNGQQSVRRFGPARLTRRCRPNTRTCERDDRRRRDAGSRRRYRACRGEDELALKLQCVGPRYVSNQERVSLMNSVGGTTCPES
jgi:hypothetical protein